jgi:hypothetical protein
MSRRAIMEVLHPPPSPDYTASSGGTILYSQCDRSFTTVTDDACDATDGST